jgi:hypothetical protein
MVTKVKDAPIASAKATTNLSAAKAALAGKKAPVVKKVVEKKAKVVDLKTPVVAPVLETADVVKAPKAVKEKVVKEKTVKAPKEIKEPKEGISTYLREIMVSEGSTECAVTFGEANVLVKAKFPERKKLYPSEFDRNFDKLVTEGKLKSKKPSPIKVKVEKVIVEKAPKAIKEKKVKAIKEVEADLPGVEEDSEQGAE